jgi:hypothetical protein
MILSIEERNFIENTYGIVLENKNGVQVVNLDYVIKLREYPYNKKGKRSTIIDM